MLALNRLPRRHRGRRGILLFATCLVFFLPILVSSSRLSAQRTGNAPTSFTARLINLEATAKETFRYTLSLHNGGARSAIYELHAETPRGWNTVFKVEGMQVSSLKLDSTKTQNITLEITPGPETEPGKYPIPVTAISESDNLQLSLEAAVKGAYGVSLSTPSGRLSDDITEGSSKLIQLVVKNTGTLPLDGLELSAQTPSKWEATLDPSKIDRLQPGESKEVSARLGVPDKTIAGDYMTTFTAKNKDANASAAFRMSVTTSLLSGWLGVLVILIAAGMIYYLIRKYGRR